MATFEKLPTEVKKTGIDMEVLRPEVSVNSISNTTTYTKTFWKPVLLVLIFNHTQNITERYKNNKLSFKSIIISYN